MSEPSAVTLEDFAALVKGRWPELDAENLGDMLWLAQFLPVPASTPDSSESTTTGTTGSTQNETGANTGAESEPQGSNQLDSVVEEWQDDQTGEGTGDDDEGTETAVTEVPIRPEGNEGPEEPDGVGDLPIQITAAQALRDPLGIARALRPLMQRIPSPTLCELDEEATALQWAELEFWSPVIVPAAERWFDLALVVEDSPSLHIWEETIRELVTLVEGMGAFRQVSTWRLQTVLEPDEGATAQETKQEPRTSLKVCANWATPQVPKDPKVLQDPGRRRVIWVVSDCTDKRWDGGEAQGEWLRVLQSWGSYNPVGLVQMFPEWLWSRTGLAEGRGMRVQSAPAGADLKRLAKNAVPRIPLPPFLRQQTDPDPSQPEPLVLPVMTLEPEPLKRWARITTGKTQTVMAGFEFQVPVVAPVEAETGEDAVEPEQPEEQEPPEVQEEPKTTPELTAEQRVQRFCGTASITAQRLAGLLAAVPVNLPIIYLVQRALLPESRQVHVAEVLMGGLLKRVADTENSYEFREGVRQVLLEAVPLSQTVGVLDALSADVAEYLGLSARSFGALLSDPRFQQEQGGQAWLEPFAKVGVDVLSRLGGEYQVFAAALEAKIQPPAPPEEPEVEDPEEPSVWPPVLETFSVEMATVQVEEVTQFKFETATIAERQSLVAQLLGQISKQAKWVITKRSGTCWGRVESLGDGVALNLVEIQGGTFKMGSPKGKSGGYDDERPQHNVTLGTYWIGQGPVTQAQWRVVAGYDPVDSGVEMKAAPSHFEGDDLPVEQVSWYEAKEFCARLTAQTGWVYDLPTEAEWEYAARAGTETPFCFGEMITTNLANYNGNSYNNGPQGEYRERTTPVGTFPANAWGLYDVHGNVWEWCLDHWHDGYQNKPDKSKENGCTAWTTDTEGASRLLRGGSWYNHPRDCRSAYRNLQVPGDRNFNIGFRVVCRGPRTQ